MSESDRQMGPARPEGDEEEAGFGGGPGEGTDPDAGRGDEFEAGFDGDDEPTPPQPVPPEQVQAARESERVHMPTPPHRDAERLNMATPVARPASDRQNTQPGPPGVPASVVAGAGAPPPPPPVASDASDGPPPAPGAPPVPPAPPVPAQAEAGDDEGPATLEEPLPEAVAAVARESAGDDAESEAPEETDAAEQAAAAPDTTAEEMPPAPEVPSAPLEAAEAPERPEASAPPATEAAEPPQAAAPPVPDAAEPPQAAAPPVPEAAEPAAAAAPPEVPEPYVPPEPENRELPADAPDWLRDRSAFDREVSGHARLGKWRSLAEVLEQACETALWASAPEVQASLLIDLAHLLRDRLGDKEGAVSAYAQVAAADPAHAEALEVLSDAYRAAGDYDELYALYLRAAEARWDPAGRLALARKAADTARRMGRAELATAAWERIWSLGERDPEVEGELTRAYRATQGWDALAVFLEERLSEVEGAMGRVLAWEVCELHEAVRKDPVRGGAIAGRLLAEDGADPLSLSFDIEAAAAAGDWPRVSSRATEARKLAKPLAGELLADAAIALREGEQYKEALEACTVLRKLDVDTARIEPVEEACLEAGGAPERLLEMLSRRADEETDRAQRLALIEKAARIAEGELSDADRAAELWNRAIELDPKFVTAHEALEGYYRSKSDHEGVAKALEGQLAATEEVDTQVELLRRLGAHYAETMKDDEAAERCWRQLLDLQPGDVQTRSQFVGLHERRGDFESIDSSLLRQIWLTDDQELNLDLRRRAARNAEDNLEDEARAVEAWQRVLDVAPSDLAALDSAAEHAGKLERWREQIGWLEEALAVEADPDAWEQRALALAKLLESKDEQTQALIAFERIVRLRPTNYEAIESTMRIWLSREQHGTAVALLEHLASTTEDEELVSKLLRLTLEALGDRKRQRVAVLRRLIEVEGPSEELLDQLEEAALECDATAALYATLEREMRVAEDAAARERVRQRMIKILMRDEGGDKARAYVLQQSPLIDAAREHDTVELERLATASGRAEDLLAVIEASMSGADQATVASSLERRARLCQEVLEDPARALEEHRRRLELDPSDLAAVDAMESLAREHKLWPDLDDALAWLLHRVSEVDARQGIHKRRHLLRKHGSNDDSAALDVLLATLREPSTPDAAALVKETKALEAWDRLLPLLAAVERSRPVDPAEPSTKGLKRLAKLCAEHDEKPAALTLYADALRQEATDQGVVEAMTGLADETKRWDQVALALRMAAARQRGRADGTDSALELLDRVAEIYASKLDSAARAVEVHRAILDLDPGAMESLGVMIDVHRERKEWRDLRDRLQQWIEHSDEGEDNVGRWLEIARVSVKHLDDPDAGLAAYASVLGSKPDHKEATKGIAKLREEAPTPETEVKVLAAQWKVASKKRAAELALETARLQEEQLGDPDDAIDTLFALVDKHGPTADVLDALARLLRQRERWADLVDVLEQRAETGKGSGEERLAEAVTIAEEYLPAGDHVERLERLYRKLWETAPSDTEAVARLFRLLGAAGDWEALAEVLRKSVEATGKDDEERPRLLWWLARVLNVALDAGEELDEVLGKASEVDSDSASVMLAQAARARDTEDIETYVKLREKHAETLDDVHAAVVMCHLAEVADETEGMEKKTIPYYRRARKLDRDNGPASEALKAYGRRLKKLRPAAALLPEEGEREMTWRQRADKLFERGRDTAELDESIDWLRRAVAVEPHHIEAWEALAQAYEGVGDHALALEAWIGAVRAFEWTAKADAKGQERHAALLEEAARLAVEVGSDRAEDLVARAHLMDPERPGAALSAADLLYEQGDVHAANALLTRVLRKQHANGNGNGNGHGRATFDGIQELYCRRAELLVELGREDEALEDYGTALTLDPLSARALGAATDILRGTDRPISAVRHALRWLLVLEDARERGGAYSKLARLLDEDMQRPGEALACVEMALSADVVERDIVSRALERHREHGDMGAALRMTDVLIEATGEPDELASLWTTRGTVLAAQDATDQRAVEAFEMALSYDPDRSEALNGLASVLEAREDWEALSALLEPMAQSEDPRERATVFRKLASFALARGDVEEAAEKLMEAVEIDPKKEDLVRLDELFAKDETRFAERLKIACELLEYGPPWAERLVQITEGLVGLDDARSAYAVGSFLLRVSRHEPQVREMLHSLRKDYERGADIEKITEDVRESLVPRALDRELSEILVALEIEIPELALEPDESARVLRISENMSHGKVALEVAEALGLEGERGAYRADTLEETFMPIPGEVPGLAVRADVLQRLVHGASAFVTAWGLELTHPGRLVVGSRTAAQRAELAEGLWAAVGLAEATSDEAKDIAEQIADVLDEDTLETWNETLAHYEDPVAAVTSWWEQVKQHAFLVAAALVGDQRQVLRAMSLVDEAVPQVKTLATAEAMDELIAEEPSLQEIVARATRATVWLALDRAGV